jgi:hypothetical protein
MKAVLFHQHGGPEVLQYADIETPKPGRAGAGQAEGCSPQPAGFVGARRLAGHQAGISRISPVQMGQGKLPPLGEGVSRSAGW